MYKRASDVAFQVDYMAINGQLYGLHMQ